MATDDNATAATSSVIIPTRPVVAPSLTIKTSFRFNPHPEDGQSQSVRLGVRDAMRFSPDGVLCSVADQPNLGAKTVLRILNAFEENQTRIVRPAANGRMGNPVLFPNDLFEPLCALTGDVGGSAVIRQHSERVLTVETTEEELKDVDRETEAQT